jgi:hypothetical protein
MYRILAERDAVRERRAQRTHPENAVPRCQATAPNQLWSWDITKIAMPGKRWLHRKRQTALPDGCLPRGGRRPFCWSCRFHHRRCAQAATRS